MIGNYPDVLMCSVKIFDATYLTPMRSAGKAVRPLLFAISADSYAIRFENLGHNIQLEFNRFGTLEFCCGLFRLRLCL